jgi:hypothetical protein
MNSNNHTYETYTMPVVVTDIYEQAISDNPYNNEFIEEWKRWQQTEQYVQNRVGQNVAGLRQLNKTRDYYGGEIVYELEVYTLAYRAGYILLRHGFESSGRQMPEPQKNKSVRIDSSLEDDESRETDNGIVFVRAVRKWFDTYRPDISDKNYDELIYHFQPGIDTALFMGAAELYIDVERSLHSKL